MPQIVDARAAAMFVEGLPLAKADSLADPREVVAGAAVARAFAILEQEERRPARAEDAVPLSSIGARAVRLRDADSGTKRLLPFFPRLMASTASLRSTSLSSSPIASLTRSPVTAISPNSVEQVHPRSPYDEGSCAASVTISAI